MLGVTVQTLQRWEREKRLIPVARTQTNEAREVKTLVMAHKDRLVHFGFVWFQQFCTGHGCELLALNQQTLSPEQEMVQDLITIVHCFSSRLYGLCNYRETLIEALQEPQS